jgi:hypothetical protein
MTFYAFLVALTLAGSASASAPGQDKIPAVHAQALDGRTVDLPRDLHPATVLILGFSQGSQDATTAWEKQVRTGLASPTVGFYDMPMLASIPSFVRSFVMRSIRKKVPDVLKPNFLPLTQDEEAWKQVAGFAKEAPDAAYVLVVDREGIVRWQTHAAATAAGVAELAQQAHAVAAREH